MRPVSGMLAGLAVFCGHLLSPLTQAEPQRHALVVGVREYPVSDKLTSLGFTESDAEHLAATLEQSNFRVTLMTQTGSKGPNRERFAPNAALIRKQFRDLVGEPFLAREDCLLVILEGHGIQLPSRAAAEAQTYYFCPADAQIDDLRFSEDVQPQHNLIPVQELYVLLKKSGAGVKLLVVDACRNDPNKVDHFRSANSVTRPPVPAPPGGIAALFSCSVNQRAAEDADLKHGVFSYFLIEALGGKADLDGDRQIDLTELHKYVGSRTYSHVREKYSIQQLPEFKGEIQGWAPLLSIPQIETLIVGARAGEVWDKNSLGLKFRWCPPGTFKMGSPVSEKNREADEDQVNVTLTNGFWLGQYEVTQAEWERIMGTTVAQQAEKGTSGNRLAGTGSSHPMYFINWEDAMDFCKKLTSLEHAAGHLPSDWEYTLPTEAQWEYACRAGTETAFSFGGEESRLGQYTWWGGFYGEGNAKSEQYAHQVGQKKPNPWGLYDMHGNVWEWCRGWYTDKLPGGVDPEVVETATHRVVRGGCWAGFGWHCRSAYRRRNVAGNSSCVLGFRVALVQTR